MKPNRNEIILIACNNAIARVNPCCPEWDDVINFGMQMYNLALDHAAKEAEMEVIGSVIIVDKQSILKHKYEI